MHLTPFFCWSMHWATKMKYSLHAPHSPLQFCSGYSLLFLSIWFIFFPEVKEIMPGFGDDYSIDSSKQFFMGLANIYQWDCFCKCSDQDQFLETNGPVDSPVLFHLTLVLKFLFSFKHARKFQVLTFCHGEYPVMEFLSLSNRKCCQQHIQPLCLFITEINESYC